MPFVFSTLNFATNTDAVATASAADAGFPATNIMTERLDEAWRAPTGSSRWIKLAFGTAPATQPTNFIAIVSPLRLPILGDCTIELLDGAGAAAYPAVTVAAGVPGMPDRRFMWTDAYVDANAVRVTVPAGSYVSRIFAGFCSHVFFPYDNLIVGGWTLEMLHKQAAQNSVRGVFLDSSRLSGSTYRNAPKRRRIGFGLSNESGLIFEEFDRASGSRECVVMPRPALYTASTANLAQMQATSIYGALPREIALRLDVASGEYSTAMEIAERV